MRFALTRLSLTFLLARAGAEIGPDLLDGTDTPTLHRDIARSQLSIEDLLKPFAGKKTGLAFRVHHNNDAKVAGGVADAIVAALRETGLPADPAEAAAVLEESPVPLSITLQYEYINEAEWPSGVKNLAEAFGETNGRAEVEGGLLLHAYLSTAGAAALPSHEDLGDILVVQLSGAKTWAFDADDYVVTLEPGDGLVIPADTRHAARATEGGVSAHLTIHRIGEHQTDVARRQLRFDDEDQRRCYSGDAYCPSACEGDCDDCVYCTDADTICRSEVEKDSRYDGYPYNICCLTVGYEIERAEPCECPRWPGPDPDCAPVTLTPTSKPRCDGDRMPAEDGYPAPGPYVVTWHVWDHAEGMGFSSKKDAEKCYNKYKDKVTRYATRLYNADFKVLEQYGAMDSDDWNELQEWARAFLSAADWPLGGYEPTRKPTSGGYAPTYKPTRKSSGECEDDETWEYFAGDKGYKRCDHVAKKPDPRCGRVSDDGVVASVACPKTCGTCD